MNPSNPPAGNNHPGYLDIPPSAADSSSNRDLEKLLIVAFGQLMLKEEYPSVGELVDKALPIISTHYLPKSAILKALELEETVFPDKYRITDEQAELRNKLRSQIKKELGL